MSILEANAISFSTSLGLVLGYHLYLRFKLRNNPAYTIQAINAQAREIWVESIMTSRERDVLAVQTLRNSTMAATFLASTAILLIIGVLNLMQKNDGIGSVLELVQKEHLIMSTHLWGFKLLPLLVIFFLGLLLLHAGNTHVQPRRLPDQCLQRQGIRSYPVLCGTVAESQR